jgi:surface antigen
MGTRRVRTAIAATLAVIAIAAGALVAAPASAASASTLCVGYTGCASLGMGNHGYDTHGSTSYWRMYPGHNCTNYAAYMMVRAGEPNTRPFTTSGDAWGWGHGLSKRTDSTPKVGAVAWWDKSGSSSLGHVAYVEAVLSPTAIIVSEDNYGGDFDWRVITSTSGWPSGFIHIVKTQASSVPELRTSPKGIQVWNSAWQPQDIAHVKPGSTVWVQASYLNTGTATWTGLQLGVPQRTGLATGWLSSVRATGQQQDSVEPGQWGTFITRLTVPSFADTGDKYTLNFRVVTAGGKVLPYSTQPLTLTADTRDWLQASPTPLITGTATEGTIARVSTGTWAPAGVTLKYQWYRDGVAIAGATSGIHGVNATDVGRKLTVAVTGTKAGYIPATRLSAPTAVVRSKWSHIATAGTVLLPGQQLVSGDGRYAALIRSGGALAVVDRFTSKQVWTTGALGIARVTLRTRSTDSHADRVVMRGTGRLQLETASARVVWASTR